MLEDKVYGYHEVLGAKEYSNLDEVIKDYFLLWINHGVDNFNVLKYRGYNLKISDKDGQADYYQIKCQLENRIKSINEGEEC